MTENTNTTALEQDQIDDATQDGRTPGEILRQAREEKGWLKEDIAARLNLRLVVLNDIENNIFGETLSDTFMRGYLRAYARLIGANEIEVLDAFDKTFAAEDKPMKMQSFSRRTVKETNDTILKIITWVILLAMFGSLAIWWWQDNQMPISSVTEMIAESTPAEKKSPAEQRSAEEQYEDIDSNREKSSENLSGEGRSDLQSSNSPTSHIEMDVLTDADIPLPEIETITLDGSSSREPNGALSATPTEEKQDAQTFSAVADMQTLKLTFDGNCWIKVTDSTQKVLAYGEKKKGSRLAIEGKQPFTVIMGVPRHVQIEYLGKTVFRNGNEARIVVSS